MDCIPGRISAAALASVFALVGCSTSASTPKASEKCSEVVEAQGASRGKVEVFSGDIDHSVTAIADYQWSFNQPGTKLELEMAAGKVCSEAWYEAARGIGSSELLTGHYIRSAAGAEGDYVRKFCYAKWKGNQPDLPERLRSQ